MTVWGTVRRVVFLLDKAINIIILFLGWTCACVGWAFFCHTQKEISMAVVFFMVCFIIVEVVVNMRGRGNEDDAKIANEALNDPDNQGGIPLEEAEKKWDLE